ncbi:hypothetical protein [Mycolicibacterium fortuitum]|uniref:hypothetical protein n=1 Tax=Mycolicibacterium fortuitum TaxID=1766 RepID=UPI003AAB6555
MWDLDGQDKSRPLSEMIDMTAHQERIERSRRQAEHQRVRAEHRTAILCVVGLMAYLVYLAYMVVPGSFWIDLVGR